jgi:hypothetical protein
MITTLFITWYTKCLVKYCTFSLIIFLSYVIDLSTMVLFINYHAFKYLVVHSNGLASHANLVIGAMMNTNFLQSSIKMVLGH